MSRGLTLKLVKVGLPDTMGSGQNKVLVKYRATTHVTVFILKRRKVRKVTFSRYIPADNAVFKKALKNTSYTLTHNFHHKLPSIGKTNAIDAISRMRHISGTIFRSTLDFISTLETIRFYFSIYHYLMYEWYSNLVIYYHNNIL